MKSKKCDDEVKAIVGLFFALGFLVGMQLMVIVGVYMSYTQAMHTLDTLICKMRFGASQVYIGDRGAVYVNNTLIGYLEDEETCSVMESPGYTN